MDDREGVDMQQTTDDEPDCEAPRAFAALQSTSVHSASGRPAYVVHAAGAPIPATAPGCPTSCWCGGRP